MTTPTTTKERPILFKGEMVRAILDGSKTQTRRIAKEFDSFQDMDKLLARFPNQEGCSYGKPGDRLWVRETWAAPHTFDDHKPREIEKGCNIHYAATENLVGLLQRPSIFMPRWASRILLEITAVRVERLNAISESDAMAEGVIEDYRPALDPIGLCSNYRVAYRDLWESINGPGSWDANPYVWVVEFKRVQP